jgi:hypothetical protein
MGLVGRSNANEAHPAFAGFTPQMPARQGTPAYAWVCRESFSAVCQCWGNILVKIRRVNVSEFLTKSTNGRKCEILAPPGV